MRKTIHICFLLLLSAGSVFAQSRCFKGSVTDLVFGSPIMGTEVTVGGNRTVTDIEGRFSIIAEQGESLIRFRIIGYHALCMILPDSIDTEIKVSLREEVYWDNWKRTHAMAKYLSYSPYISVDFPDVQRIIVKTEQFVPKNKLIRVKYGRLPYYAAKSIQFEDENGNPIHSKECQELKKRLRVIPSDIVEFKGFVTVSIDNSSETPTFCYERK